MPDLTAKSFAGVRNTLPAERLAEDDLAAAVNVDVDNSGRLSRRDGQTLLADGVAHSLWADKGQCLYVLDGMMYTLDPAALPTLTARAVADGLGSAPVSYAMANERVYHSNGAVTGVFDAGRVRSWGIALDTIAVNATPTAGNLAAGVYLYTMTLLRDDGQESGAGLAQRIDLADGQGIVFNWDVPFDASITECALYLSQPNGEVLYQALVLDVEQGSATYSGGPRSLPLATQWYDAPPAGQVLAAYKGRIYIAAGNVLYATVALSYEHCDLRDYRAFDDSRITIVAPVEGGLFVGTERAVYFLSGASFADNSLNRKLAVGALAGSVIKADGEAVTGKKELANTEVVLFCTLDGVVMGLPDGSLSNMTRERYQLPAGESAAAVFSAGTMSQYLLSINT